MAKFWLAEENMDRWVLNALPGESPGMGLVAIHAQVCYLLRKNAVVACFQFLPVDSDVLVALNRPPDRGLVMKELRIQQIGGIEERWTWYWTPVFRFA